MDAAVLLTFDEGSHPCDLPLVLEMPLSTMTDGNAEDFNFRDKDWVNTMPEARFGDVPKLPQNCPGAPNVCGGCTPLQVQIGGSGAPGYVWACDGDNAVSCEQDLPKNACGGTVPLQHKPGTQCPGHKLNGECWTCKTLDLVTSARSVNHREQYARRDRDARRSGSAIAASVHSAVLHGVWFLVRQQSPSRASFSSLASVGKAS